MSIHVSNRNEHHLKRMDKSSILKAASNKIKKATGTLNAFKVCAFSKSPLAMAAKALVPPHNGQGRRIICR